MEHAPFKWLKMKNLRLPEIEVQKPDEMSYDEPFEAYLNDLSCINSSALKMILRSPRHFISWAAGMLDDDGEERDAFRFGRAAHMMLLEPAKFREMYVVEPEFIGLTKDGRESKISAAAKDMKRRWYEDLRPGALVITEKEREDLDGIAESIIEHPQASNLLKKGKPEVTGRFTDPDYKVRCRIRPDYITWDEKNRLYISDLKTTRDASAGLFATDVARFKYYMQLAFYYDGVWQITKQQPEAAAFIAIEKKPPYSVAVYWLNEEDLAKGRQWYKYALMTYVRCIRTNQWPSIQSNGEMLSLPKWTDLESFPQYDFKDMTDGH